MNKALKQFELSNSNEFDLIKISIASPEKIVMVFWGSKEARNNQLSNF